MTVGETLAEARSQAGLSVDDLSERTRIRGTVIRSIEQDDYEACGGDLYVRGYVRAIAGAVGIDAQPLIRDFDLGRLGGGSERANGSTGRHARGLAAAAAPDAAQTIFDLPAVMADLPPAAAPTAFDLTPVAVDPPPAAADPVPDSGGPDATRFDLPAVRDDPATTRFDLPPVTDDLVAEGYSLTPPAPRGAESGRAGAPASAPVPPEASTSILPALGPEPAGPHDQAGPAAVSRRNRRTVAAAAVVVVVLVAAGILGTRLVSGSTATHNTAATSVPQSSTASASAAAQASAARASAAAQASAAQASASASASSASASAAAKQAATAPVTALAVASVRAFGPDGYADGDNAGSAAAAIARKTTAPWTTQWYATPRFGMLKHGTGLLLSLGRPVTLTSVRLDLGQYGGATLQLRAGNGAALQDLPVVATASNAAGTLRLTLHHPVTAKYLLIWITVLPPDGAGHYQASVSHVVVSGRR